MCQLKEITQNQYSRAETATGARNKTEAEVGSTCWVSTTYFAMRKGTSARPVSSADNTTYRNIQTYTHNVNIIISNIPTTANVKDILLNTDTLQS